MPIYEYECKQCDSRFEKIQPMTSEPLTECANCGQGPVRRVMHQVGVIFKGSGWYINDSRKSNSASSEKEGGGKTEATAKETGSQPEGTKESVAKSDSAATTTSE